MPLRYLTLLALVWQWAVPFAKVVFEAAHDGKIDRHEVERVLHAAWPTDHLGRPREFKLPFYRGD